MLRPAALCFASLSLLACLAAASVAQEAGDGVTVKPYTGKPVLLDEGEKPPAPRVVSANEKVADKYDDESPRIERQVAKYSDDSLVNNGYYKEYYKSGQLFIDGSFDMGLATGEWTYYHPNGKVAKTVTFAEGEPDGTVEVSREDGTLKHKREYAKGKRNGVWTNYDETGEVALREERYKDGVKSGMWKQWYPSGKPWRETPFKDDQRHGTAREWNEDGSERLVAEFVEGKRDGKTVNWAADGTKTERVFKEGKLVLDK